MSSVAAAGSSAGSEESANRCSAPVQEQFRAVARVDEGTSSIDFLEEELVVLFAVHLHGDVFGPSLAEF